MKHWGIIIAFFYGLLIALLLPPLAALCLGESKDFTDSIQAAEFWIYALFPIAGAILLVLVPVDISNRRVISRRKLLIPIITSALLLGFLMFMLVVSVLAVVYGDDINLSFDYIIYVIIGIIVFWTFWAVLFYINNKTGEPGNVIGKIVSWMLKGSVLELLIAIPSHIIVRQRDDCCAPLLTFAGMVTGFSILLLSFGPGIIFLYAKKISRHNNKTINEEHQY